MNDLRGKLLALFQVEHREHLDGIREALSTLSGPRAGSGGELDEAFRRAHSLKGAARVVDLSTVESLAHDMETLFGWMRDGSLVADDSVRQVLHVVLDAIEDWVQEFSSSGRTPDDPVEARRALEKLLGKPPGEELSSRTASPRSDETAEPIEAETLVRVRAAILDELLRSSGALFVETGRQGQIARELASLSGELQSLSRDFEELRRFGSAASRRGSVLEDGLGERLAGFESRLRSMGRSASSLLRSQRQAAWELEQLTRRVEEGVQQARIVPVERLVEGLRRMTRDVAVELGKEIELEVRGLRVEADRAVVEALRDPLVHLLRNAVSHGIETPDVREQRGKPRQGRILVDLRAASGRLTLVVEDDGCGVDEARIRALAVEQGLIDSSDAHGLPASALAELLFRPGFTTSPAVTRLSGRGMGLSIVAGAVSRLQGHLELLPARPHGTRVRLTVPASLVRHKLLLLRCGDQTFAVLAHDVERLSRFALSDVTRVEGGAAVEIEGESVPLARLADLLGLPDASDGDWSDRRKRPAVVLRAGERRLAISVTDVAGEIETLVKDLGPLLARVGTVSGGVILPDGSPALLLDPRSLLPAVDGCAFVPWTSAERGGGRGNAPRSVLVVDDSITTRALEKSILEARGFDVSVAMDGVEALELLRARSFDLVIADIEMPRLDGFGLLKEMKDDERLRDLPVIVVSSRARRDERERGLSLGAEAYLVKESFDQTELLATIDQIL